MVRDRWDSLQAWNVHPREIPLLLYELVARRQFVHVILHLMQVLQADGVVNLLDYALDCRALMISTTGEGLSARSCD